MAPDTDNGRVTLAVLGEKMDHLSKAVQEYCARNDEAARDRERRLQSLERRHDVNDEQHRQMVKDAADREKKLIEDQTQRTWASSAAAAAVGMFSAVVAYFGGSK